MTVELLRIPIARARSNTAGIAQEIGTGIIAGRYGVGTRLPGDAELTARFGVSRPVLRESLKTLAAKGLVVSKARVGTVVRERAAWNMFDPDVLAWNMEAGIDQRFLQDLAEIRLAVEPRAAALAARRRSDGDLAAMRAALARMRREPSDAAGFADGDFALHLAVATASGNTFMRSVGAVIEVALRASFMLSAPVKPEQRKAVLTAHELIVDTVAAGDPDAAAEAMAGVIFGGLRRHGVLGAGIAGAHGIILERSN